MKKGRSASVISSNFYKNLIFCKLEYRISSKSLSMEIIFRCMHEACENIAYMLLSMLHFRNYVPSPRKLCIRFAPIDFLFM